MSEIVFKGDTIKEISRVRLGIPEGETSYCVKNWMPVLDMPNHFVKWTNPTQVIEADPKTGKVKTVYSREYAIKDMPDLRGGSQVVRWKNFRIAIVHQSDLFKSRTDQKDADYSQRLVVWDLDWNILHITDKFKFMDGDIEFCCGMDLFKKELLISYGFQDNASYLIGIPEDKIEEIFDLKYLDFDWGPFKRETEFFTNVRVELFVKRMYDLLFEVEEDDVVVDVGASVGPYAYSIMEKNPLRVICLEPQTDLFNVCQKNLAKYPNVICLNKGISLDDGDTSFDNMFKPAVEGDGWWKQTEGKGITLKTLVKEYGLEKIDFLKIDCEGGEYDFFTDENYDWIMKNVRKIAGEFHIFDEKTKAQFIKFRDKYMVGHDNYTILSYDGHVDSTDIALTDEFVSQWKYFMIFIDNR